MHEIFETLVLVNIINVVIWKIYIHKQGIIDYGMVIDYLDTFTSSFNKD